MRYVDSDGGCADDDDEVCICTSYCMTAVLVHSPLMAIWEVLVVANPSALQQPERGSYHGGVVVTLAQLERE